MLLDFAPLVWSQAVITEVYGVHILFVVLILFLSSGSLPSFVTPRRLDLCLGLAFGLGMGNHVTMILLLPLLFSALPAGQPRFPSLLRRIAGMGAGLLVYLTLPLPRAPEPSNKLGQPRHIGWLPVVGDGRAISESTLDFESVLHWFGSGPASQRDCCSIRLVCPA